QNETICTCNECNEREVNRKNAKKRQLESEENTDQENATQDNTAQEDAAQEDAAQEDAAQEDTAQEDAAQEDAAQENATQKDENSLELIELTDLCSYLIELLNTHSMQLNDDSENVSPLLVQCAIDISTYDKSTKEVVKELIELIEIPHEDSTKHYDTPTMERFNCHGTIKITISQSNNTAKLVLKHKLIHAQPKNVIVSQDIKEFIKENINLLPREIYAQLVENGLNPLIWQKQIHFWWSELGQNRYRRQDDAFESAIQWLREGQYKIILEQLQP
ncbi:3890_t:CDS:2, partial [Gigaspora rosea]